MPQKAEPHRGSIVPSQHISTVSAYEERCIPQPRKDTKIKRTVLVWSFFFFFGFTGFLHLRRLFPFCSAVTFGSEPFPQGKYQISSSSLARTLAANKTWSA